MSQHQVFPLFALILYITEKQSKQVEMSEELGEGSHTNKQTNGQKMLRLKNIGEGRPEAGSVYTPTNRPIDEKNEGGSGKRKRGGGGHRPTNQPIDEKIEKYLGWGT